MHTMPFPFFLVTHGFIKCKMAGDSERPIFNYYDINDQFLGCYDNGELIVNGYCVGYAKQKVIRGGTGTSIEYEYFNKDRSPLNAYSKVKENSWGFGSMTILLFHKGEEVASCTGKSGSCGSQYGFEFQIVNYAKVKQEKEERYQRMYGC